MIWLQSSIVITPLIQLTDRWCRCVNHHYIGLWLDRCTSEPSFYYRTPLRCTYHGMASVKHAALLGIAHTHQEKRRRRKRRARVGNAIHPARGDMMSSTMLISHQGSHKAQGALHDRSVQKKQRTPEKIHDKKVFSMVILILVYGLVKLDMNRSSCMEVGYTSDFF